MAFKVPTATDYNRLPGKVGAIHPFREMKIDKIRRSAGSVEPAEPVTRFPSVYWDVLLLIGAAGAQVVKSARTKQGNPSHCVTISFPRPCH